MKKLLFLSLILTTTLKAQVSIGNIFNTDAANQMNINWRCSSEVYPNVNQLPSSEVISFKVRNNGKIKISPDIFNDGLKPKNILKILGIKKNSAPEKQAVSVDSSACMAGLYASLKSQFAQNTKDCATKKSNICKFSEASFIEAIEKKVEESDFAKKTKDSHKLPQVLAFNNVTPVDYQLFTTQINAFCDGKTDEYDKELILTGGFLKQVNFYSKQVNAQPNVECIEKLKTELSNYSEKLIAEHCAASTEVCEFLKTEKQTVDLSIDEFKKFRTNEVEKKDAEYRLKVNLDWENEFEGSFKSMLDESDGEKCGNFVSFLTNADKTKYVNAVTMTKLVSKNVDSLFAKMSARCQQTFIRQYIEQNTFDSVIKADYDYKAFCKTNKAKICTENRQYTADIEKNLERMLELSYGQYGKDYFREQLLACEKENVNDLNSLLNKLKTFDKVMTCAPLKEGQAKIVGGEMPTGLYSNYTLKKTGPNETTAILNIDFTNEPGAPVSGKEMEERVKNCMENVSPFMKGGNGEQLKIKILNPKEVESLARNERPSINNVAVASGSTRSHSRRYDPNVDCTTITHEVMHLLGLCDEYEEKWDGSFYDVTSGKIIEGATTSDPLTNKFVNKSNCRNVVSIPSVMKSQDEVFSRAVPRSASCECSGDMCKSYMGGAEPLQKLFQNYGWDVIDSYYRQKFCKSKLRSDMSTTKYLENPKQFTLLTPASETKITYNFKYASPDAVKSVDMTCDCANPQASSDESAVNACKAIVARVSKSIADDIPPKDNRTCPPGTIEKDGKWGGNQEIAEKFNGNSYEVFKPRTEPVMNSILYPEQFNRIVGGACDEVSPLYSKCSQFAYKTEFDDANCKVPEECKDMNKLMGIPQ